MTDQISHTAILLFTRSSRGESAAKKILPGRLQPRSKDVVQKFIDSANLQAKNTHLPLFVWNEQMQQGSTFGEKLANAIDSVFQKGFQKIIVIGNDCLTLTSHQINKAASGLIDNDAVIAPTCKGGVYLLGITKSLFDKQGFINVRWQTSSTCQDLLTLMAGQQVFRLPIQDDVNSYVDLRKQLTLLIKNSALRIFLDGLISLTHIRYFRISDLIVSPQPQYSFGLKAPPASLS